MARVCFIINHLSIDDDHHQKEKQKKELHLSDIDSIGLN
jgi:hypothetical protein